MYKIPEGYEVLKVGKAITVVHLSSGLSAECYESDNPFRNKGLAFVELLKLVDKYELVSSQ